MAKNKNLLSNISVTRKHFESGTLVSLLAIILAVFVGGYILNLFIGGGLFYNIENFENSNINGRIVYYYMNGCPACEQMNPIWDSCVSQYNGDKSLDKIEQAQAGSDLVKYNIQGFPTIVKLDAKNNLIDEFNMDRTITNLLNFMNS